MYIIVTTNKKIAHEAVKDGSTVIETDGLATKVRLPVKKNYDREIRIAELLGRLGIKPRYSAYKYLHYILLKTMSTPGYHELPVTVVIYPECGEEFGVTSSAVEKSIIYAMKRTYLQNLKEYEKLFNAKLTGVPRPAELIKIAGANLLKNNS